MTLADVIGKPAAELMAVLGRVRLHTVGDTGRHGGSVEEENVAAAMTADFAVDPLNDPALFFHLGDVIYGTGKDAGYRDAFYRPFMEYPGKIIAIPGNHDGETFPTTDPVSLRAFLANFCLPRAEVPPMARGVGILRQMVPQPGVYWWLQHELFDVIALYSNIGEGQGELTDGKGDDQQVKFLTASLTKIAADRRRRGVRKALVIATHHPPYSSGGHSGSAAMLMEIDEACAAAGIVPHMVLSGHAHNYQRYTRTNLITSEPATTTFLVAGTGGYGLRPAGVAGDPGRRSREANALAAANPPVYEKAIEGVWVSDADDYAGEIVAEFRLVAAGVSDGVRIR